MLHWDCFLEGLCAHTDGAIPTGHVWDYCRVLGIEDAEIRWELLRMVRFLATDYQRYLAKARKQAEARTKRLGSKSPRGRGSRAGRGSRRR